MLQYETSQPFRDMANACVRVSAITKFPAQVMLAVWANESAWGANVTGNFNYWGITRAPEDGPAKFCLTHEDITEAQLASFHEDERATAVQTADLGGGKCRYRMQRWFASYASLDESVQAYTEFFTKSPHRYQAAWQRFLVDSDADGLLKRICEAGYATGNAESVEMAIEHQSNVVHAIQMAEQAQQIIT